MVFTDFLKPKNKTVLKVENLKDYIYKLGFENSASFVCLSNNNLCLIYLDESVHSKIINPFGKILNVYTFDKNRKRLYFKDIKLDDSFEPVSLNFFLTKDKTHNNVIIESENKLFVLDSGYSNILLFDSLSEYLDYKDKFLFEVKDAF